MIRPSDILTEAEIKRLRRKSVARALFLVAHAWAVIAGAMALVAWFPNPATYCLAVAIIGARQLGLAILMHDAAHGLLTHAVRSNDLLSQWLCAFPIFADTRPYRPYHMQHHRRTQRPDDPDLGLSKPFPITRASLARKILRDLTFQTAFQQRRAQVRAAIGRPGEPLMARLDRFRDKLGGPLVANAALFAILAALGHWELYPLLWIVPLGTTYMVVLRVRNIAEHAMVTDNEDDFRNARTTRATWLERAFIAPYYVNYHVEHHLFPFVPAYRLPEAHAILLAKGLGPRMEIRGGYREVLALATSKAA